uniref:SPX domain-containing protein n=1 Tax=Kalanchoe fedtschenkoi TaxID=63787 RepID=A0A7N1A9J8_KALFE
MKFGKELQAQQVPEWQDAYMNYNFLKKLLKDVIHFKQQQQQHKPAGLARRVSLYRAFSGLTCRGNEVSDTDEEEEEEKAILVSEIQEHGCGGGGRSYQTMFLRCSDEGGEIKNILIQEFKG